MGTNRSGTPATSLKRRRALADLTNAFHSRLRPKPHPNSCASKSPLSSATSIGSSDLGNPWDLKISSNSDCFRRHNDATGREKTVEERVRSAGSKSMAQQLSSVLSHIVSAHALSGKKKHHVIPEDDSDREPELPQDFIDKQRAYFAEIDAFELAEEEVSESELE